jgi:hypothetical protein
MKRNDFDPAAWAVLPDGSRRQLINLHDVRATLTIDIAGGDVDGWAWRVTSGFSPVEVTPALRRPTVKAAAGLAHAMTKAMSDAQAAAVVMHDDLRKKP